MEENKEREYSFDIYYTIKLILKWKMPIIIACVIAAIATYFFTGPKFIVPLYKANVIFYPTTNTDLSTTLMTEPGNQGYSVIEFGSDEDAEQLLQILTSEDLKNNVIIKYELAAHYGLDTSNTISMLTMRSLLSKNLEVKQTEYKAIEVTVFDRDPKLAAEMANYIANYADTRKNMIQKVKVKEALNIISEEYERQKNLMDSLNKNLAKLRNLGIYDYFEQSSQLNEAYTINKVKLEQEQALLKVYEENKDALPDTLIIKTKARVKGYQAAVNSIQPKLDLITEHGGTYLNSINTLELERKKLLSLKMRYESAKLSFEKTLPQKFTINDAGVPEIPAKPRRLLTTAIVTISTLIFALIAIVILDYLPIFRRKYIEKF
jgi:capsular polysaccharide biosynthesis protein